MDMKCSGYSGSVQKHWRVLCNQGPEEGRHYRQGRGGVLAGGEENLRGGQLYAPSLPRQPLLLLSNQGRQQGMIAFT